MREKTKLEKTHICEILKKYKLGKVIDFSLIPEGCVHSNYVLLTERGKFVLRVFEEKTDEQIHLEMKLLEKLLNTDVPVPNVILTKKGNYVSEYCNKKIAIFTFLEGKHIRPKDASLMQISALGTYLGRFHCCIRDFKPKETLSKENRDEEWIRKLVIDIRKKNPDLPEEYENCVLENVWNLKIPSLYQGFNHADLNETNVLLKENKVTGILDFDECFYGNLLYDVGCGISCWCYVGGNIDFERCKCFIQAYGFERKLTSQEINYLYRQTRFVAVVRLIYWILDRRTWGKPLDPLNILTSLRKISNEDFISRIFSNYNEPKGSKKTYK